MTPAGPSDASMQETYQLARMALVCLLAGDGDGLERALLGIVERGPAAMFATLCGWASVIWGDGKTGAQGPERGYYALDVQSPRGRVDIDSLAYDEKWVARFLIAFANGDQDMQIALFQDALGRGQEELAKCSLALLRVAASRVQGRAQERRSS